MSHIRTNRMVWYVYQVSSIVRDAGVQDQVGFCQRRTEHRGVFVLCTRTSTAEYSSTWFFLRIYKYQSESHTRKPQYECEYCLSLTFPTRTDTQMVLELGRNCRCKTSKYDGPSTTGCRIARACCFTANGNKNNIYTSI